MEKLWIFLFAGGGKGEKDGKTRKEKTIYKK
jgi:hypothetical protein